MCYITFHFTYPLLLMSFINPIDILNLQSIDVLGIDPVLIKKAKRKVRAEIELSDDGQFTYNGASWAKSDVEKAIDELTDQTRLEFYHSIANNSKLNNFLSKGDIALFDGFRIESIYKLPEFLDFISPYFATRYDQALSKAFKQKQLGSFKKIISVSPLVNSTDRDRAYKSTSTSIRNGINDLNLLTNELRTNENWPSENDVDAMSGLVEDKLPLTPINLLPNYLQGLRNQVAQSIRNLSVNLYNATGEAEIALELLQYAASFTIDGITMQNLEKDIKQLQEIHQNEIRNNRVAPIITKYADVLSEIMKRLEDVQAKATSSGMTLAWVNSSISISELNSLDLAFDEVRNQIALGLKAMSVAIWNSLSDIDASVVLMEKALSIKTDSPTHGILVDAKNQLDRLKGQVDLARRIAQQNAAKSESSNNGCVLLVGIAVAVAVIYGLIDSSSNNSSSSAPYNASAVKPQEEIVHELPRVVESKYKGNRLANGTSPYDHYFGKGIYNHSHNNFIEFKNGNSYDAIVCVVNVHTGRTIRNEYIRANSTFKMTNVPNGTYTIKAFYGNDWNPNKTLMNGAIKGGFDTNFHFSKSDGFNNQMYLEDDGYNYSTYTVTLYTVANGNMSQETINESEFF